MTYPYGYDDIECGLYHMSGSAMTKLLFQQVVLWRVFTLMGGFVTVFGTMMVFR